MKYRLYKTYVYGVVLLFLSINFFSSCSKEDTIAPVITSVNLSMNDTIRNNFNIKVDATDNKGIKMLELYANDSLIARINGVPFEFLWKTTEMKDGAYLVKAIIYDSKGNKAESACNVLIQNALLTINLGSEFHSPFKIVISDEQGIVLNSVTMQGTGKRTIKPLSQLEDNAINIMYCSTSNGFTGIISYIHVKRGSEFNMDWRSFGPNVKGVKLHLKNDIDSFSRIWLSTDWGSYQITTMADTATLPNTIPYSSGHKLLLQIETSEGRFYKFLTIDDIEEITEKLSDINTRLTIKSYSVPPTRSSSFLIMGKGNEADSINRYYISQGSTALNENHFDILYPPEYFSKYYTFVSYSPIDDNYKNYANIYQGEVPDRFDPLTAEFDIINSKTDNFNATISGDFDFYQIAYYDSTQTVEFSVSAPVNQKKWKLPDPAIAFDNPNYIFDKWSFVFLENQGDLDWTNKYYDVSIDFEDYNFYAKYSQSMWITNPLAKGIKIQFPSTFRVMNNPIREQIRNF
jgi:hypothetical protein